jgi:hypothetical protein
MTRFLDDPYIKEGDSNTLSSYFVLYFYLIESLGKAFRFHRAKIKIKDLSMSLVNQSHCLIAILLQFSLYKKFKLKI